MENLENTDLSLRLGETLDANEALIQIGGITGLGDEDIKNLIPELSQEGKTFSLNKVFNNRDDCYFLNVEGVDDPYVIYEGKTSLVGDTFSSGGWKIVKYKNPTIARNALAE